MKKMGGRMIALGVAPPITVDDGLRAVKMIMAAYRAAACAARRHGNTVRVGPAHDGRDLALLVGADQRWLSTTGFLDKVAENLTKAMAA